jgi:hypothetical protein
VKADTGFFRTRDGLVQVSSLIPNSPALLQWRLSSQSRRHLPLMMLFPPGPGSIHVAPDGRGSSVRTRPF